MTTHHTEQYLSVDRRFPLDERDHVPVRIVWRDDDHRVMVKVSANHAYNVRMIEATAGIHGLGD